MKKSRVDAKKIGPLKLAALNGLSLSRLPMPDEGKEVSSRATNDERVRTYRQWQVPSLAQSWGLYKNAILVTFPS
jgi:hypothetical protein